MKHLKHFEDTIEDKPTQPKVGDYVICREDVILDKPLRDFMVNNIGKILNTEYCVIYQNIPSDIKGWFFFNDIKNCRFINRHEIIHFSPDKEDLLPYIQANKYNL